MSAGIGFNRFNYDPCRAEREFLDMVQALGLHIESLRADGEFHRCDVADKGHKGKGDGSYLFHMDGGIPLGFAKNWITGEWSKYRYERAQYKPLLTATDRELLARQEQLLSEKRERDRQQRAVEAAAKARSLLAHAHPILGRAHRYLAKKKIEAHGLTMANGEIIVPMVNGGGELVGAQRITSDGEKFFLTGTPVNGAFHVLGEPEGAARIVIAEGVATAATIRQALGCPVVIAFNAGNLVSVAKVIWAKFPSSQLLIAADDDHSTPGNPGVAAATAAAREVGCVWLKPAFPAGREDALTDFNDLAAVADLAAVREQFDAVPTSAGARPMSAFARLSLTSVKAPEFVIDAAIQAGVVLVAGAEGVGKTVQMVSLLAKAAHLCRPDDPLRPRLRRKVIYITEDPQQVQRILSSLYLFGDTGCNEEDFRERFLLVEAVASSPDYVATLRDVYIEQCTLNTSTASGKTYEAKPLVVFDTKSAVFQIEDENDNSEASRIVAMLKQTFALPAIVIGHLAKALKRSDVKQMSARGAGAFQCDAHQVMFFFADEDTGNRYLSLNSKRRFDTQFEEIEFVGVVNKVTGVNVLDEPEIVQIRHATCRAIQARERHETKQDARAAADDLKEKQESARIRGELMRVADKFWAAGTPASRRALVKTVQGKEATVTRHLTDLLTECHLLEVTVDASKYRLQNNSRKSYIVALGAAERERLLEKGEMPDDKRVPPLAFATPISGA